MQCGVPNAGQPHITPEPFGTFDTFDSIAS